MKRVHDMFVAVAMLTYSCLVVALNLLLFPALLKYVDTIQMAIIDIVLFLLTNVMFVMCGFNLYDEMNKGKYDD